MSLKGIGQMERYILKRTQSNASFLIFYKIFVIIYIENEKEVMKNER